jgi:hypothetical protein
LGIAIIGYSITMGVPPIVYVAAESLLRATKFLQSKLNALSEDDLEVKACLKLLRGLNCLLYPHDESTKKRWSIQTAANQGNITINEINNGEQID